MTLRIWAGVTGLIIGTSAVATAQQPPLDMRTGLWEMASERSATGMPEAPAMPAMPQIPPEVLAKMTPAQRAQIEGAMRARSGAQTGKKTKKVCVTAEALRRSPDLGLERRAGCTVNKSVRSARGWQVQQTCIEGGRKQTLDVRYDVVSREAIEGTIDIAMSDGARNIAMKQAMRGRWLSADCGTVKPLE